MFCGRVMVMCMVKELFRLSIFSTSHDKIEIYDRREKKVVQVVISNRSAMCLGCSSDECIHAGYALGTEMPRE